MKGTTLYDFLTSLNGGATIELILAGQLVETARTIIEEEREWAVLKKTDTSKTITTSNTWQTVIDISTITDFSRFYGDEPIKIFDGNNQIAYYCQKPFDRRLEYKDSANTFVFDENAKRIYLNGVVSFAGTLYINYISTSPVVDLEEDVDNIWSNFPPRFAALLGFYAIGVFKGAIDYDSINKLMLPENRVVMSALKNALEKWDNSRQQSAIEQNDPTDLYGGFRNGAINTHEQ